MSFNVKSPGRIVTQVPAGSLLLTPGFARFALFSLILVLFVPVLGFGFLMFDDDLNIYNNPHLGELTWSRIDWMFSDREYLQRFMPFGWLQFSLIFEWAGLSPGAYHVSGWVLHAINAVLVSLLVDRLIRLVALPVDTGVRTAAAFLGAAMWAAHPLRVEPVAWASGLLYVHATFWALLSTWFAWTRLLAPGPVRGRLLVISWICYAVSVLIYPVALGLSGVFLACEWWFNRKNQQSSKRLHFVYGPFFVMTLVVLAANSYSRLTVTGFFQPAAGLGDFGVGDRLLQSALAAFYFLWRPWVAGDPAPVKETFSSLAWFLPLGVACALAVVAWFGCAWLQRARWPAFAAWTVAYVSVCIPFYGLLEASFQPSDRYTYLPSIIWMLGLVTLLLRVPMRWMRALGLSAVIFLSWFVIATRSNLPRWGNNEMFFSEISRELNNVDLAELYAGQVAVHQTRRGEFQTAAATMGRLETGARSSAAFVQNRSSIEQLKASVQISSTFPLPVGGPAPDALHAYNLARAAVRAGEERSAEVRFQLALDIDPGLNDARYDFAIWLAARGRTEEARAHHRWLAHFSGHPTRDSALKRLEAMIDPGAVLR